MATADHTIEPGRLTAGEMQPDVSQPQDQPVDYLENERPPLLLHLAAYLFAGVAVYRSVGLIAPDKYLFIVLGIMGAGCLGSYVLARYGWWLRVIANTCVLAVVAICFYQYFKFKPPVIELLEWSAVGLLVGQAMGACRPKHYTVLATLALILTLIAIRRSGAVPQRIVLPVLVFGLIFAATQVGSLPERVVPPPDGRRIIPWPAWCIRVSLLVIVALIGGRWFATKLPLLTVEGRSESLDLWVNYVRFTLGLDSKAPGADNQVVGEMPNNDRKFLERFYASRAMLDLSETDPGRLTHKLLMTVRTERPMLLRGVVLDEYDGRGWRPSMHLRFRPVSNTEVLNFIVPIPEKKKHSEISGYETKIWVQSSAGRVVYHPVLTNSLKRGSLGVVLADPLDNLYSSTPLGRGTKYSALLVNLHQQSVAQSEIGGDSEEVREQYLQLPIVSDRLIRHCHQAIVGEKNRLRAVNKLIALVQAGKSYDEGPKEVPEDQEATEYFFFEMDGAACSHFASALAVTCRIVGIPARVATGFGYGTYDAGSMSYEVREKDSHAWTQVWFPEIGWVDFDPTPGRFSREPPVQKRESAQETLKRLKSRWETFKSNAESFVGRLGTWFKAHKHWPVYGLVGAAILFGLWQIGKRLWRRLLWRLRWMRTRRMPPRAAAAQLYGCCIEWLRRIGLPVEHSMTPSEIVTLTRKTRYPWSSEFESITNEAERMLFGGEPPSYQQALSLRRQIAALKAKLGQKPAPEPSD